jgi:hypothetical protein
MSVDEVASHANMRSLALRYLGLTLAKLLGEIEFRIATIFARRRYARALL